MVMETVEGEIKRKRFSASVRVATDMNNKKQLQRNMVQTPASSLACPVET